MNIETANRLASMRKENNLSQEQLAEKIGVSRQAVSKWERGESSPDTDNLIALAQLYGVSLDELVGIGKTENVNSEKTHKDDKVHIGFDGIHVYDAKKGTTVDIGLSGIHVDEGGGHKVSVDKNGVVVDGEKYDENYIFKKIMNSLAGIIAIAAAIAFLMVGFTVENGFSWSWLFFLLIPLIPSLAESIRYKKPSKFLYPVFCVIVFMALGFFFNLWHPGWIVFITIPIYYMICGIIEK